MLRFDEGLGDEGGVDELDQGKKMILMIKGVRGW